VDLPAGCALWVTKATGAVYGSREELEFVIGLINRELRVRHG
jgi:hypothetical protein